MNIEIPKLKFAIVLVLLCASIILVNMGRVEKLSSGKKIGLENIPKQMGDWKMINAQTDRELIKKWEFMNETLMRTYTRPDGKIIWLAIVYGCDQRQAFSLHMPEACYRAAGFDVEPVGNVSLFGNGINLKRLIGRRDGKTESISYWVVLDGKVVTNNIERKIRQLYYTIFKKPAFGAVVRISSLALEENEERTYSLQAEFIIQLARNISPKLKPVLFGDMITP
jgi:EpsI family protein